MRTHVLFGLCVVAAVALWVGCGGGEVTPAEEATWTCSMHPQIRLNHPGNCPICGMILIKERRVP